MLMFLTNVVSHRCTKLQTADLYRLRGSESRLRFFYHLKDDGMQILIEAGASINTSIDSNWTPLHETAAREHIDLQRVRLRLCQTTALMETFEDPP